MKKFFYLSLLLLSVSTFFCACSDDDNDDLNKASKLTEGSAAYNQVVDSLCATPAFADTFHLSTEQFVSFYKFQKDGTMNIFVCSDNNLDGEADMDTLNLSWKIEETPAEVDKGYKCYYLKLTFDMNNNNYDQSLIDTIEVEGGATVALGSLVMKVADNGEVNLYGPNDQSTRGILNLFKPFVKVLEISTNIYTKFFNSAENVGSEEYADWMSNIKEDVPVSKLAIPGSHVSFAYNLVSWNIHERVQEFDTNKQWNMGVRCFDAELVFQSQATVGVERMEVMYKGSNATQLYMEVNTLKNLLTQHPGETAILIANIKSGDKAAKSIQWLDAYIQNHIEKGDIVKWHPGITMKEARGHIIFITRYISTVQDGVAKTFGVTDDGKFSDTPAWGNNLSNSYLVNGQQTDTYATLSQAGQVARLYVQDYDTQTEADAESYYSTKKQLFADNITYFNQHINDSEEVWSINYMSGSQKDSFNPELACAEVMNPYLEDMLNGQYKDKYVGIILVDWVGLSKYMGLVVATLHNPQCSNIPSLILKHNNNKSWNNMKLTNSEI